MVFAKLDPGDEVRIIAPAGKGSASNLPLIKSYVESLDLVPIMQEDVYDPSEPFYSNSDEYRAQDLISALKDDNCKAIWTITGGSGCIRLIKYLESELEGVTLTPKILVGYSDITVLHLYLQYKFGWASIQGPMLNGIAGGLYDPNGESVVALVRLLFNVTSQICEPQLTRLDSRGSVETINGVVTGGNLTLVEASIKTKWGVDAAGKILFLEDVSEAAYSIERSLDHMKQVGIFNGVVAIIFGDFTEPDSTDLMDLVLQRFADDEIITCPVFRLTGIGHGPVNFPLPFNTSAVIRNMLEGSYQLCVENLSGLRDTKLPEYLE